MRKLPGGKPVPKIINTIIITKLTHIEGEL